jgi:hypothetical protein
MKLILSLIIYVAALSAAVPDCSIAPGWQQSGELRAFEGESLYEYMNGNSEGYLIYGFKKMTGVTCKKDANTVNIDVSDMGEAESAYGIFSANRDVRVGLEKIGAAAQVGQRKATAVKDRFYLEIAAEAEGDHTAMLRTMITALERQIPGTSAPPPPLTWFPTGKVQPGYPRLVPQSVLGIRILKRGYVAHYDGGMKAFLIPEATPEAATATAAKLRERLGDTQPLGNGFSGQDKYLGRMVVFQKGNYVGGVAGGTEADVADAIAAGLQSKLP